jgi:hypothetical protein
MSGKIFYLFILFFVLSCASPIYKPVTGKNYNSLVAQSELKKLILLSENHIVDADYYAQLISQKKWTEFDSKVQGIKDKNVRYFLIAIQLLIREEYYSAYRKLALLPDSEFDCEVVVLKADCLFGLKVDSVDLRKRYQKAFDCTSDIRVKSIAETRLRFVRYGI